MELTLQQLLDLQEELQVESFGLVPGQLDPEARAEFVRWNVLALEDELHEALAEIGWKPWATSRHLNREEYVGELVDALHFMLNLLLVAGVTGSEIAGRYWFKREKNAQRQEQGYDGVSTKCPNCHRELGDGSTGIAWYGTDDHRDPHCGACGQKLWTIDHAYVGDNLRGGPCSCGGPRLLHTAIPREAHCAE